MTFGFSPSSNTLYPKSKFYIIFGGNFIIILTKIDLGFFFTNCTAFFYWVYAFANVVNNRKLEILVFSFIAYY